MPSAKLPAETSSLDMGRFAELDRLIDQLISIIDDENALLASGMPASLAATTGTKSNLAGSIEERLRALGDAGPVSPEERAYLDERITLVQSKAKDNLSRLAGAIGASRRRIAAVVAAVRESGTTSVYGRTGNRVADAPSGRSSLLPDRLA
ncbi:flagellar protein FlgN [Pleomorphomonas sp. JP5]|uniref:flagellar protein FlgN n=1 Tax=Pleomorphomonas sp. JP5 TaxID=2942998 RepID=UPI0020434815|nr:flagellar protein FlgN [Pleomorphomonas sp. JP5]MCM5560202.1 flagellar protein FlgN [Pleomorphomonas sp. JP5]